MSAARVLDRIVDAVRGIYGDGSDEPTRWGRVGEVLQAALGEPELRAAAGGWPTSHDRANRRYTNLLFYEDPDFGFVVNGLVKDETGRTPVHDHGHAWVAYGLLEGAETILRYRIPPGRHQAAAGIPYSSRPGGSPWRPGRSIWCRPGPSTPSRPRPSGPWR